MKAARAHQIKGTFILSVVLQLISSSTFVIAPQFALVCVARRSLEEERSAISTTLKYFTFPRDCIPFHPSVQPATRGSSVRAPHPATRSVLNKPFELWLTLAHLDKGAGGIINPETEESHKSKYFIASNFHKMAEESQGGGVLVGAGALS